VFESDPGDESFACGDCVTNYCLLSASELRRRYGTPLPREVAEYLMLNCARDADVGRRLYFAMKGGRAVSSYARLERFPNDVPFSTSAARIYQQWCPGIEMGTRAQFEELKKHEYEPLGGRRDDPSTTSTTATAVSDDRVIRCGICFVPARKCEPGGGLLHDRYGVTTMVCERCIHDYCELPMDQLRRWYVEPASDSEMEAVMRGGHGDHMLGRRIYFNLTYGRNMMGHTIDHFPTDTVFEQSCRQHVERRAKGAKQGGGAAVAVDPDSLAVLRTANGLVVMTGGPWLRCGGHRSGESTTPSTSAPATTTSGPPTSRARRLLDASNPKTKYHDAVTKQPLSEEEVTAGMRKETIEATARLCQECEAVATTKRCSRCLKTYFCSRECQARQYFAHKRYCYPVDRALLHDDRNAAYREFFLSSLFQEAEGIRWLIANGKTSTEFQRARLLAYDAITAIVTHLDPVGCVLPETTAGDPAKASIRDKCAADLKKAGSMMLGPDGKFKNDINMPLFWSFIPKQLQELICAYMI
jgi:hypothetical protein